MHLINETGLFFLANESPKLSTFFIPVRIMLATLRTTTSIRIRTYRKYFECTELNQKYLIFSRSVLYKAFFGPFKQNPVEIYDFGRKPGRVQTFRAISGVLLHSKRHLSKYCRKGSIFQKISHIYLKIPVMCT